MRRSTIVLATVATLLLTVHPSTGAETHGFSLAVLLDGVPRPEYAGRGQLYVEAVRGREYALRITNPLPVRVAVALAVDGLNTIDAVHGDAASASKWVVGPYETVEISGWQVNGHEARRFYFTGERRSYGAWLGHTADLGVIEAVFYRERCRPQPWAATLGAPSPSAREEGAPADAAGAPGMAGAAKAAPRLSDEYAATGIGERTRHDVQRVHLDLEPTPAAVVRIRYEFRDQLARLGLLPPTPCPPLDRRERAHGFTGGYCPDPQ